MEPSTLDPRPSTPDKKIDSDLAILFLKSPFLDNGVCIQRHKILRRLVCTRKRSLFQGLRYWARRERKRHAKSCLGAWNRLASQEDVLRGSSRVHAPWASAELKDKFFSHCSQTSAGDHMQIIGDPIGAVEVKVLTSQTHKYKLCRLWYVTKDFCSWRDFRR